MADTNRENTTIAPENASSMATSPASGKQQGAEGTHHRSKMSEEYDEALEKNTVAPDGPDGERLNQDTANVLASNNGNNPQSVTANASAAPPAPPAPGQPATSPAENALSTQADDKMGAGEELRDREFPVPPQQTTLGAQRVVVDQGLMSEEGARSGEAVGTLPGDRQNVGEAPNIMDQHTQTPDFPAQR